MTEQGTYALITRRDEEGVRAMLTLDVEGKRILPLFESVDAAEEFVDGADLSEEWQVADDPDGAVIELLREMVAPHVEYVTLNPPVSTKDSPAAVSVIPVKRFVEDC